MAYPICVRIFIRIIVARLTQVIGLTALVGDGIKPTCYSKLSYSTVPVGDARHTHGSASHLPNLFSLPFFFSPEHRRRGVKEETDWRFWIRCDSRSQQGQASSQAVLRYVGPWAILGLAKKQLKKVMNYIGAPRPTNVGWRRRTAICYSTTKQFLINKAKIQLQLQSVYFLPSTSSPYTISLVAGQVLLRHGSASSTTRKDAAAQKGALQRIVAVDTATTKAGYLASRIESRERCLVGAHHVAL